MKKTDRDIPETFKNREFESELERFLRGRRSLDAGVSPEAVCGKVKTEYALRKRRQRTILGMAASVFLAAAVWFSASDPGANQGAYGTVHMEEDDIAEYAEVLMLEEYFFGAEALGDDDAFETLDLLSTVDFNLTAVD